MNKSILKLGATLTLISMTFIACSESADVTYKTEAVSKQDLSTFRKTTELKHTF